MNLETSKSRLLEILQELKALLQNRDFDVFDDSDYLDGKGLAISFNGYGTEESFENHALGLFEDLQKAIKLSYIYDLNIGKRDILIQMMIEDLSFDKYIPFFKGENNIAYSSRKEDLAAEIRADLELFEELQSQLRSTMLSQLKNMLSVNMSLKTNYQFKWQGNQKQLAELFGKMILEGWIENPLETEQSAFANAIAGMFDVTPTYTKDNPNVAENFRQYLKPAYPNSNKKLMFPNCVTGNGIFSDFPKNIKILKNK